MLDKADDAATRSRNAYHTSPSALARQLREAVRGEVYFDAGTRALYATDASNYRQPPIGVVVPRDVDDVIATVAVCKHHSVPVLSRGGGTSLAGQCCNTAVVMDMSKYMNRIITIDPQRQLARVQSGVVLDDLRDAAEEHGLTFAPDPSTHTHNTLGGMIGNNSCGVHSVMGGRTSDNVHELDILLYDGMRLQVGATDDAAFEEIVAAGGRRAEIYTQLKSLGDRYADDIRKRYPDIPRRVSGYNLDDLLPEQGFHLARALVGSESTCVTVLEATVRLVPSPPARVLLVLGYPDVYSAGDHVPCIMQYHPIGLEGMDMGLVRDMQQVRLHTDELKLMPEGGGWLIVEFGDQTPEQAQQQARTVMHDLEQQQDAPHMRLFSDPQEQQRIWHVRESALGATAHIPNEPLTWPGWEDSAVPPDQVGSYLRDLRELLERYGYAGDLYGHFGQGCIHTRIDFELATDEGIRQYRSFMNDAADLVLSYGGTLSGEHGDGQARGELLPRMFGDRLMQAFREFKTIWDPDGKMNPGKVVDADAIDQHLRLGRHYDAPALDTAFRFPQDQNSFPHAVLRCVGVGKCRRQHGGTMCPSYRATRDERHSTRGRSRLLFEMLRSDVITSGWRSKAVHEALDLCLSCKGCKSDCPVDVDMATYKAEFLYHYYKGRIRPRQAYAYGLINHWARYGSHAPRLVNFLTQTPGLSAVAKAIAGMPQQRSIPAFAPQTFKRWFADREPPRRSGQPVLLWADTFNNYFHPHIARAAVQVLEAAGFDVQVPQEPLCCGRPLYDFGMLDLARSRLERIMQVLHTQIDAGVPVVGLEPSCVAVFRDELPNLFPDSQVAHRLRTQSCTLAEFLDQHAHWQPPHLPGKALVHAHCHHKSVLTTEADHHLLDQTGLDYEWLDSGCCGMAGAFGFEPDKYAVSLQVGEQVLLPAVRKADADTLLITDGFSCREQISQTTGRRALHLAEALALALDKEASS
ncbi:MAG: FAD-linked oxidase C-terminal domain-containing protein [Thiogranum sp.]|nr:FAD-linked oxidase C-terminal domain-containing protein [Thiogranum sp.]